MNHHPPSSDRIAVGLPGLVTTALVSGAVATLMFRNFFESEKKVTHAIHTDYDVKHPTFSRTISQLLGPPILGGNQVEILENGDEIFPAMLRAIQGAQHSITFENFVFTRGQVVAQFVSALAGRARAGVKVHFLQDAMGCNCLHGEEMAELREAGVQVEIFRYVHLRFNERTHRKLLIVDGRMGFIGGVGISDEWMGNGDQCDHWRDTQYRVQGPVVAQMQQAFMDNWIETRAEVLHGDRYFPEEQTVGKTACQAFKSSSSEGADSARLMFLFSIAAARQHIRIATAYFVPDALIIATLVEACGRGVEVEIITPGPFTDRPVVRHVGRSLWEPMLKAGVKLYEFQPARYHCKYMIVDDHWTSVGSFNVDNRSLRLNEEANLNIMDAEFAQRHVRIFEQDKARSKRVTLEAWQRRPLAEKLIGRTASVLKSQL